MHILDLVPQEGWTRQSSFLSSWGASQDVDALRRVPREHVEFIFAFCRIVRCFGMCSVLGPFLGGIFHVASKVWVRGPIV